MTEQLLRTALEAKETANAIAARSDARLALFAAIMTLVTALCVLWILKHAKAPRTGYNAPGTVAGLQYTPGPVRREYAGKTAAMRQGKEVKR